MDSYQSGSTFASYTIEGLVAGGGMGQVYAARHEVYATPVALKVLHPRLHKDPSWMKRFSVEGLVGTRLKHPNVLSARELVTHNGRIALVMDLVSGGQTLEKVISREHRDGLSLVQGLKVFLAIVQGVEYLHGKAITHGDMKPENVLIAGDYQDPDSWTPQVTDFGTVTLIADPVEIDGKPAVVATPRYASPEHLLGIDKVEPISDIYSLGLVLHFLLTGKHPSMAKTVEAAAAFTRAEASVVDLVDQPDSLIALYTRCREVDPEDRFQDCREVALAVRSILDEIGVPLELDDLQADLATEIDEERQEEMKSAVQGEEDLEETVLEGDRKVSLEATTASGLPAVDPEEVEAKPSKPAPAKTPEKPARKSTPAPDARHDPVPADQVDPDAAVPGWLWLVIAGTLAFLLMVVYMSLV